jgi:asparagine synthase (glutamine-hydrolysing)
MDGINTYFVSWAARQAGLKVALSGLGGDEIFGGYGTFRAVPKVQSLAAIAGAVPRGLRSLLGAAAEKISWRLTRNDARRKLAALWRDPNLLPHSYYYARLLFTPSQVSELLTADGSAAPAPWYDWLMQTATLCGRLDDFTAVSCLESRSYLLNTLLRDTDSMSMAHSLEVRVPFLDHPIAEFVARLPRSAKCGNGTPKSLLVEAMGNLLPAEVVSQPKRSFTLPWEPWLRGPLKREIKAGLHTIAPSLKRQLNAGAVEHVWRDFLGARTSWSRVWGLFVLNKWALRHLEN